MSAYSKVDATFLTMSSFSLASSTGVNGFRRITHCGRKLFQRILRGNPQGIQFHYFQ